MIDRVAVSQIEVRAYAFLVLDWYTWWVHIFQRRVSALECSRTSKNSAADLLEAGFISNSLGSVHF